MARYIKKTLGLLFIVTALIVTQIPAQNVNAESQARQDFLRDNDILTKYSGTATTVSVPDDIKEIGEEAFANNQYIGVINFNKNVKRIDHGAFANCSYLNNVILPDSVEYIDSAAFTGCSGLKKITLGEKCKDLGDGVFAGCTKLTGIDIPKTNDDLLFEAGVLYDNKKEKIYSYLSGNAFSSYMMPNSVNRIAQYSFWGNENLEDVYLSSNLAEISGYSFANCKNLRECQIPYSVNSIGPHAFENCISLREIVIPPSVTYIDSSAFDGCVNLNIIAEPGTAGYIFAQNFDKSDISITENQDVKTIVSHTKQDKNNFNADNSVNKSESSKYGYIDASKDPSNVDFMPSVESFFSESDPSVIGKTIVVNGQAVFFINREMDIKQIDNSNYENANGDSRPEDDNSGDNESSVVYDSGKGGYLPKYTYINGKIAAHAFYSSKDAEDFEIKSGTKSIGDFAFARSNIVNANIPEGVETIGYGAFYHCEQLESVNIPNSVKFIDQYAFSNTPYMEKFLSKTGDNPFLIVGDGILLGYNGKESNVIIPEGVKTISAGCFRDNKNMTCVSIPKTCNIIDSDAFRDCTNLITVLDGENITEIRDRAFMNCPLDSFVINDKVEKIGLKALDFSSTNKSDDSKAVVFKGNIPTVSYDKVSSRLSNFSYRQDSLYNVIFAIVDDDINSFDGTVLDNHSLGFSGLILSIEKDSQGNESGFVKIKKNYVYSIDVMNKLPSSVVVNGKSYTIKDLDSIELAKDGKSSFEMTKSLDVLYNGSQDNKYYAKFSEAESVGKLYINDSDEATSVLNNAYSELFGGDNQKIVGYDITLKDSTDTVSINKFGHSSLYISVPIPYDASIYHVISLDEDGQLEEIPANIDTSNNSITFETNHLSYFGIYGIEGQNVTLNLKNGKLIKDYRLDESPDTGDGSFPIKYIIAIALGAFGIILLVNNKSIIKK